MFYHLRSHLAAVLVLCVSCGSDPAVDLGDLAALKSGAPRIVDVAYIGQSPVAKQVLIFQISFEDDDGDLKEGYVEINPNQNRISLTRLPLKPLLLQSEVHPGAKRGVFQVPVDVSFTGAGEGRARMRFEIALQLRDALGHKSNLAKVRLLAIVP